MFANNGLNINVNTIIKLVTSDIKNTGINNSTGIFPDQLINPPRKTNSVNIRVLLRVPDNVILFDEFE